MINNKFEFKGRIASDSMTEAITHVLTECSNCERYWIKSIIDIHEECPICREVKYVN